MYKEIPLHLSRAEASKLKKGEEISIKAKHIAGTHKLHISKTKHEKILRAIVKGKDAKLKLSKKEYLHNQGRGFFSKLGNVLKGAAKAVAPTVIPFLKTAAKAGVAKLASRLPPELQGVANDAVGSLIDKGGDAAGNAIQGSGLRKKKRKQSAVQKAHQEFISKYLKAHKGSGDHKKVFKEAAKAWNEHKQGRGFKAGFAGTGVKGKKKGGNIFDDLFG